MNERKAVAALALATVVLAVTNSGCAKDAPNAAEAANAAKTTISSSAISRGPEEGAVSVTNAPVANANTPVANPPKVATGTSALTVSAPRPASNGVRAASVAHRFGCQPGQPCNLQCSGAGCAQACAPGGQCNFTCTGGGCTQTCADSALCNFTCEGGACKQSCAGGAPCLKTCTGGGCS